MNIVMYSRTLEELTFDIKKDKSQRLRAIRAPIAVSIHAQKGAAIYCEAVNQHQSHNTEKTMQRSSLKLIVLLFCKYLRFLRLLPYFTKSFPVNLNIAHVCM